MKWKPQIFWFGTLIATIAMTVILVAPEYIEVIAGSAITAIGMLGMKLLESDG